MSKCYYNKLYHSCGQLKVDDAKKKESQNNEIVNLGPMKSICKTLIATHIQQCKKTRDLYVILDTIIFRFHKTCCRQNYLPLGEEG